jgi:hypothetical protein
MLAFVQVLEETGLVIDSMIDPHAYLEARGHQDKPHKLFIVTGLDPQTAKLAPQNAGVSVRLS